MITRDPDITRLLDRLEKRSLISRCRETKDRRMVMARITPDGLELLARPGRTGPGRPPQTAGPPGAEAAGALTELLKRVERTRPVDFFGLIFVETNIVVTHLNQ